MHFRVISSLILAFGLGQNALGQGWMNEASLAPGAFSATVERANTYRLLESQHRNQESGNSSFQRRVDFDQGKARARAMAGLIQDKEIKQRAELLTPIGERIGNDEYVGVPAKAIGAGVSLWVGRSFSIIRNEDLQIKTRIEGRARSGSLALESSIVKSSIEVRPGGVALAMNRDVPLFESFAEVHYDLRDRRIGAALSKAVLEHIVVSVGAADSNVAKKEGLAQIAYSVVL